MRKAILTLTVIIAATFAAASQTPHKEGNWVIESNVKNPKVQTVKFYDENQKLIYEETINKKLAISRRRVRAKLNKILAYVITTGDLPASKAGLLASLRK